MSPAALPPLVGQWQMVQTCAGMVRALTRTHRLELIRYELGDFVEGWEENGPPPAWDPQRPCTHATPPRPHSHTFWADGSFNSYDENGEQVDEGTYQLIDDHTFRFPPYFTMKYQVSGDTLTMSVVTPKNCTAKRILRVEDGRKVSCLEDPWRTSPGRSRWPGERWKRVTSGPHVPPATGTSQ
jgi:hypothetical protein